MPACAGALTGEGASTSSASGSATFKYSPISVFKTSERVPKMAWTPSPTMTTPAASIAFNFLRIDLAGVLQLHAQACDARVEVHNIAASAQGADDLQRKCVAADRVRRRRGFVHGIACVLGGPR